MFNSAEKYYNDSNIKIEIKLKNYPEVMEAVLFPEVAPITVDNFVNLVKDNFYSDIIFHRVIKGFMIQGGDPKGLGTGGSDKTIKGEFKSNGVDNLLAHDKGVLSMARTMAPNSASSQIFIMHEKSPHLDGEYAAFGIVTKNISVVDKVANVETGPGDRPIEEQIIEYIKIK